VPVQRCRSLALVNEPPRFRVPPLIVHRPLFWTRVPYGDRFIVTDLAVPLVLPPTHRKDVSAGPSGPMGPEG